MGPRMGINGDRKRVLTYGVQKHSLFENPSAKLRSNRSQSSFIQLAPHFTVVDIWSEFDTEDYANP